MSYAQMHDGWDTHPKFVRAAAKVGDSAAAMFWRATSRCNMHLTDGRISLAELKTLTAHRSPLKVVNALLEVGLLESVEGDPETFQVHDYTSWQSSREQVERKREAKRRAGAAGGIASGQARQDRTKAEAEPKRLLQQTGSESKPLHDHVTPRHSTTSAPTERRAPEAGLDEGSISDELRRHPATAALAASSLPGTLLGRAMATGASGEELARAIAEAAADAPDGTSAEAMRKRVRSYCDRAHQRKPGPGPLQPLSADWSPRAISADEAPPTSGDSVL